MSVFNSVLVIDDDPILRAISQSYFAALETRSIYVAGNGRQALKVLMDHKGEIDFILCDLNMPELDGVEFLRHLRDLNFTGAIGIVSGEDFSVIETARNIASSYALQIAGTVQKPLGKDSFDELIARAVALREDVCNEAQELVDPDRLLEAIEAGQIVAYYQPKIEAGTGNISGVEALARWLDPDKGLIPPDQFIPIAEKTGLITKITDTIILQTIKDCASWKARGIRVSPSINITPPELERRSLPDQLERLVLEAGLQPETFTLEVTERSTLQKSESAMEVVARMRLKGFGISVDDFGTGASNIEQLRDFPYSELKIDKSFVQGAVTDRFALAGLKASAVFARELQMHLVAEGISNKEEWRLVLGEGIDQVQGFLFAKPMPADEFAEWYDSLGGRIPASTMSCQDDDGEERASLDDLLRQARR